MLRTKVVQLIKSHMLGSITFFFWGGGAQNRAVYEIMRKNVVQLTGHRL